MNPLERATEEFTTNIPELLPHKNVYNIQVGEKLFKISGASLSSDGPSYFTSYFVQHPNAILFIDRLPKIFELIKSHLQGYYTLLGDVDDQTQMYLYVDAVYFRLHRLANIINKEAVFARIGERCFKISKCLFANPGNTPNFLTMNSASEYNENNYREFFRPPPMKVLEVTNRSGELFHDILEALKGNMAVIRDDSHRQLLIRECHYYRFLELEQRLVKHKIICNPFTPQIEEIILNFNDLSPKGLSVIKAPDMVRTFLQYRRPYILREPVRDLVFQIDKAPNPLGVLLAASSPDGQGLYYVKLYLNKSTKLISIQFSGPIAMKMRSLFKDVIVSEEWVESDTDDPMPAYSFICTLIDTHCVINGLQMQNQWVYDFMGVTAQDLAEKFNYSTVNDGVMVVQDHHTTKKRRIDNDINGEVFEFRVLRSQWKISILNGHIGFFCTKLEAVSDKFSFSKTVEYL